MTGYLFSLTGGAVSWRSSRQAGVTRSSAEAEFVAASQAGQEAVYLRALLRGFDFRQVGATEIWEDKVDQVNLPDSIFCLTGDFVSGDRNTVESMLKLRGASISTNVNKTVDFLIIGTLASRDWLYTSHGRKIEKALLLKRDGSEISVITERTLLRFLR